MSVKKILILYLQAGGGHKSNAIALKHSLEKYGSNPENPENLEIELFDFGQNGPIKESSYIWLTEKAKPIWYLVSIMAKNKYLIQVFNYLFQVFYKNTINQKLLEFKPDIVLNTYYFSASTVNNSLPNLPNLLPKNNITAVTDTWSAPNIWFSNSNLFYLVFSQQAFNRGLKNKIPEKQLILGGYFFDDKFNKPLKQTQTKTETENDLDTVVILGGGGSMPNGEKILLELTKIIQLAPFRIVCICGRNQTLYNLCLEIKNQLPAEIQKLIVIEGFTNQVYEYLSSAKIVISKAGPASILETLALKKPIIISSYIWEQELANKDFVLENQVGHYQTNPEEIAKLVKTLLTDNQKYQQIKDNINKLNLHSNNQAIIKKLLKDY